MRQQIQRLVSTNGVALSMVGLVVLASVNLNWMLGRYPGAARVSMENVQVNAGGQSALSRQAKYQTTETLLTVRQWYSCAIGLTRSRNGT